MVNNAMERIDNMINRLKQMHRELVAIKDDLHGHIEQMRSEYEENDGDEWKEDYADELEEAVQWIDDALAEGIVVAVSNLDDACGYLGNAVTIESDEA